MHKKTKKSKKTTYNQKKSTFTPATVKRKKYIKTTTCNKYLLKDCLSWSHQDAYAFWQAKHA